MVNKKAKTLIGNYVVEKLKDPKALKNKQQKLELAGYSEVSARKNVSKVENSLYYAEISSELARKAGSVACLLMASIDEAVNNGELDGLPFKDKVATLQKLVQIRSQLSPSFKQKESFKDEDTGGIMTVWSQLGR